jgi:hypothetical protein
MCGCEPDNNGVAVPLPADSGRGVCLNFNARYRVFVSFDPPPPSPIVDAGGGDSSVADASSDAGGAVDAGSDAGKLVPPSTPPPPPDEKHVRVQMKIGLRDGVNDISLTTVDVRGSTSGAPVTLLRARASDRVIDLDLDAIAPKSFNLLLDNAFPCNGRTQTVTLAVTLNDDGSSKATARIPDQVEATIQTRDKF